MRVASLRAGERSQQDVESLHRREATDGEHGLGEVEPEPGDGLGRELEELVGDDRAVDRGDLLRTRRDKLQQAGAHTVADGDHMISPVDGPTRDRRPYARVQSLAAL